MVSMEEQALARHGRGNLVPLCQGLHQAVVLVPVRDVLHREVILSYGDLGMSLGEAKQRKLYTGRRNNRYTGDAPSNQPKVAGVFSQSIVGTLNSPSL